ncbi:mycofactocin biosynthesis chaperone MftB [Streptomyces boluensis]|uniref:Mycofactocin biosynthesis chaperone MftB n=1 Tax=Streptomyces boluensis TaxID=1775135 RepID=A0A964UJY0_9ACTN|nr:mycofactocin biosynthesis chaperone MftB [Streptomyces boluensis]NBE50022.1 mycofactocin biosynthesis chaperone MftB [Streptomyces boluensis]
MTLRTPVDAPPLDAPAVAAARQFDLDAAWTLHSQVAVRPEPFGALLYHFGTRRLSFLKDRRLLTVVQALADHPSASEACLVAGVTPAELGRYEGALANLAKSQMITERSDCPARRGDTQREEEGPE